MNSVKPIVRPLIRPIVKRVSSPGYGGGAPASVCGQDVNDAGVLNILNPGNYSLGFNANQTPSMRTYSAGKLESDMYTLTNYHSSGAARNGRLVNSPVSNPAGTGAWRESGAGILDPSVANTLEVECWFRRGTIGASSEVIMRQGTSAGGAQSWATWIHNTGVFQAGISTAGTANDQLIRTTARVDDDAWHHVWVKYDAAESHGGGTGRITDVVIDGTPVAFTRVNDNDCPSINWDGLKRVVVAHEQNTANHANMKLGGAALWIDGVAQRRWTGQSGLFDPVKGDNWLVVDTPGAFSNDGDIHHWDFWDNDGQITANGGEIAVYDIRGAAPGWVPTSLQNYSWGFGDTPPAELQLGTPGGECAVSFP